MSKRLFRLTKWRAHRRAKPNAGAGQHSVM